MFTDPRDIGSQIAPASAAVTITDSGGTTAGGSIDRLNLNGGTSYNSAVLIVSNGAATGAPTSYTVDVVVQESSTGTDGWTTISGASITQITANSRFETVNVNLASAERYIRAQVTTAFSGGTSPAVPVSAVLVLGGPQQAPVTEA